MSRLDSAGLALQSGAGAGGMGTMQPAMDFFVPVEEASPGQNFEEMDADETLGSRFPSDREIGGIFYEPSLQGKVRASNLPALLAPFMGLPVSVAGVAGDVGSHVHTQDSVLVGAVPRAVSLLLHRGDPVPPITDLFWDALGNELTLSVEPNDWLSFEASFVAGKLNEVQPAPVVVQDLTRRFPFFNVCAFLSVDGAAEVPLAISDFELNWNSNIDTDAWALCQRGLYAISPGNVDVEVSFTPLEDLAEFYRRAFLLEAQPIRLRLVATGPLIAGAATYKIEVDVARLITTDVEADVNAGETLRGVPITAQAALDPGTGKFVKVTTTNAVAGAVYVP